LDASSKGKFGIPSLVENLNLSSQEYHRETHYHRKLANQQGLHTEQAKRININCFRPVIVHHPNKFQVLCNDHYVAKLV
jgi:hypothetical protein